MFRLNWKALAPLSIGALIVLCLALAFAQRPRRVGQQQASQKTAQGKPSVINVKAGGDLQKAIDRAQPGDTILLEAGASFIGPFTLPAKASSSTLFVTIRCSTPDSLLPPPGSRITPASAPLLPKLLSPGQGLSALKTAAGAHHYRLIGIEFSTLHNTDLVYDLVALGQATSEQSLLSQVPHHLSLDRCYLHAWPDQELKRGIALNSASTEIINCHISAIKRLADGPFGESQVIAGINGPGPFQIINNYLEGADINILFGGAAPNIADLVPSDIEIRRNLIVKPSSWRPGAGGYEGKAWVVKNLLELKTGRRVVIEGNVFENSWQSGQDGWALLLTVYNQEGNYAVVEDVEIANNIIRHVAGGITMRGKDVLESSRVQRVVVRNNLFEDVDGKYGEGYGRFLMVGRGTIDVRVEHNTVWHTGSIMFAGGEPNLGFVFKNNLLRLAGSGITGHARSPGNDTIRFYFPGGEFRRNVLIGLPQEPHPENNFYPRTPEAVGFVDFARGNYRLLPGSKYKNAATDGKDIGCDFDELDAALAWYGGSAAGRNQGRR